MGSSPTTPTEYNMDKFKEQITFSYNGKIYTTSDLERKLKKLGITEQDITIQKKQDCSIGEIDDSIRKYRFKNKLTGEEIVSIYDNLNNLKNIINI